MKATIDPAKVSPTLRKKYWDKDNTLGKVHKDHPQDRIDLEFGDAKDAAAFHPQIKVKRWDNEVNFSLRFDHSAIEGNEGFATDGETIEWNKGNVVARFYPLEGDADPANDKQGAHEFDVTFYAPPTSNVLVFSLRTKGLCFEHQPSLTQAEIDRGMFRPEHVVGSYAVYHESKRDNYAGKMQYRAGKAFHIYRPLITDAVGATVWGELQIDLAHEKLLLTVPPEFLQSATYPITIDPTIGYTSIGGTTGNSLVNWFISHTGTTGTAGGTLDDIQVYGTAGTGAGTVKLKGMLVDSSKNIVTNGVGDGLTSSSSAGWFTLTYTTKPSLTGSTQYWVGYIRDGTIQQTYDSGSGTNRLYDLTNSYTTPTNPTDGTTDSYHNSIYANYTETSSFKAAWARGSNQIIGVGVHA